MLVIDIFVLRQYFSGGAYSIFRAPTLCDSLANSTDTGWLGADGSTYCDVSAPVLNTTMDAATVASIVEERDSAEYYIATHREAYTGDSDQCSLFGRDTALLDLDETSGTWGNGGHPRFTRLGWVIGGEFALYYFFATFINELADCMFVVPTTTAGGWRCKIFSVALEFAQLGALAPAAVFDHNPCLHYTAPLNAPIALIRDLIVPWGYCIWGFVLASIPLFGAGKPTTPRDLS